MGEKRILIITVIMAFSMVVTTKATALDGFMPGGAWEQDLRIVIETGPKREVSPETDRDEECLSAESITPDPYFDPREEGLVSEVRDQGKTALCWDYATISTAESALIKMGRSNSAIDLSEYQSALDAYNMQKEMGSIPLSLCFSDFCNAGGKPSYIRDLWKDGYGIGEESMYPGIDSISENSTADVHFEMESICRITSTEDVPGSNDEIKAKIRQNGAVFALYYSYPMYYNDFINEKKDSSYYMPYPTGSRNHAISIVGWDDAFPAECFVKDFVRMEDNGQRIDKPLPDGAWLVKNSWGRKAYKTPDEASGYYWISYYDRNLSDFMTVTIGDAGDKDQQPNLHVLQDPVWTVIAPSQILRLTSSYSISKISEQSIKPKKIRRRGKRTVKIKGIIYRIKGKTATVKRIVTKRKKIRIPDRICYRHRNYAVRKIGKISFSQ